MLDKYSKIIRITQPFNLGRRRFLRNVSLITLGVVTAIVETLLTGRNKKAIAKLSPKRADTAIKQTRDSITDIWGKRTPYINKSQLADVVLPAAIWGEKTGTFTNADRTVHISYQAIKPPGEARADFNIFIDYARRMDFRDNAAPDAFVQIFQEDAKQYDISKGDKVEVTSRRGKVMALAQIGDIEPGLVFIPFHYGYWDKSNRMRAANELTMTVIDPVSKQPHLKYAASYY
ncbi:hypothetical protein DSM106972_036560 [Dulcicalothrix desertica PCC 7102]|uniref:Molybdopterin dinucleotide-binding domain-containing protein n=1 Tax=Dulcicalothrix desertica PCC 7102 TaxID=232991 RepID=A0A3S1ANQ1_9CYAN|nr:molybdopterin dinucleotide binding domain-containing protein [Dulcicalothrix desertica]RUT05649.1 hypothetical protein DSM106972_036560 [Dulcicalothrix desertica PCC 7102]